MATPPVRCQRWLFTVLYWLWLDYSSAFRYETKGAHWLDYSSAFRVEGTPSELHAISSGVQGIVPLGGCKVEKVERGPKGSKSGLQITHPDFYEGRMLILSAESAEDQEAWFVALNNCSRV
jgi:hypothetical protein